MLAGPMKTPLIEVHFGVVGRKIEARDANLAHESTFRLEVAALKDVNLGPQLIERVWISTCASFNRAF